MFGLGLGWEIVLDDEELRKETQGRELDLSFTLGIFGYAEGREKVFG